MITAFFLCLLPWAIAGTIWAGVLRERKERRERRERQEAYLRKLEARWSR